MDKESKEFLSNFSSELNSKSNLLSRRKNKIHHKIAHFQQISNDIQNRNQTLQSYTLNLIQMKQKIEKDQKSFRISQDQTKDHIEKDITYYAKELEELSKQEYKIKYEINQKHEFKNKLSQKYDNDVKMIQDFEKREQLIPKIDKDKLKLIYKLDQMYIILNETQNHCQQFIECINSLDKDFDLIKKSKQVLHQKQLKIRQQIESEQSNYSQQKTSILIQTQKEITKQEKIRQEKSQAIQLKHKYETDIKLLMDNQSQLSDSLFLYDQRKKEISSNQKKIVHQISSLRKREEFIKDNLVNKNAQRKKNNFYFYQITNDKEALLNREAFDKKLHDLISGIERSRSIKNQIYSQINKENLLVSQYTEKINYLAKESEDILLDVNVNSSNFLFINDILAEIKNLEMDALNEIEKWKNCSISPTSFKYMLNNWNKKILNWLS